MVKAGATTLNVGSNPASPRPKVANDIWKCAYTIEVS